MAIFKDADGRVLELLLSKIKLESFIKEWRYGFEKPMRLAGFEPATWGLGGPNPTRLDHSRPRS